MRDIIFDMEVFPKWWCMVYCIPSESEELKVITSETKDYKRLINNLRYGGCFIGFNIKGYDLRILNAIISDCDPYAVYETSTSIINETENTFNNYYFWNKFNFSDLYDDWKFGSLKEFESNIGMSIKESEISFEKEDLTEEDIEEIINYCKHDVEATIKLMDYRKAYLDSKRALSEMFNIPIDKALKSTNAKLCATILDASPKKREADSKFIIPERVKLYLNENLPKEVIDLFSEINNESKLVNLFDNEIIFGIGGIHSTIGENVLVRESEKECLVSVDVTSYYPNLMMRFDYMSRNVPNPKLYEEIYNLRFKLKSQANEEYAKNGKSELFKKLKAQQEGLKLVLNTTYGAMKNKYNALYDEYQASSLCYLGQLLLAALANRIYNKTGAKIIQSNTDGILVKIDRKKLEQLKTIVSEWEFYTKMSMEYDYIKMFFQRDVNNYIEVKLDDSVKLKGKWTNQAEEDRQLSNLNAPITHKAILDYYMKNIPIEETICNKSSTIFDFCFTCKTGYTFDKTYHYVDNQPRITNKVNRVVATTKSNYGTIKKYKIEEDRYDKIAEIPEHCFLMNDNLENIDHLDKSWYIEFAKNKIKELKEI